MSNTNPTKTDSRKINIRHGQARRDTVSAEYRTWTAMRGRCFRTSSSNYYKYGGRGITVCLRWNQSFEAFFADMGPKPSPRHTIERIDNEGNYEPGNCRWASPGEQSRNTRQNRWLTFRGETRCISDWGAILGIGRSVIKARLKLGWTVEEALSTPVRHFHSVRKPPAV